MPEDVLERHALGVLVRELRGEGLVAEGGQVAAHLSFFLGPAGLQRVERRKVALRGQRGDRDPFMEPQAPHDLGRERMRERAVKTSLAEASGSLELLSTHLRRRLQHAGVGPVAVVVEQRYLLLGHGITRSNRYARRSGFMPGE